MEAWRRGGVQTSLSVLTWTYGGMEVYRREWQRRREGVEVCRHAGIRTGMSVEAWMYGGMKAFDGYVGVGM
jgi:hypothetical protein